MKATRQILALTLICFSLLTFSIAQSARSQDSNTSVSVVPPQSSVRTGDTMDINLTISNVQNLYALDLTLDWNSSILQLQNVNLTLGVNSSPQPHPDGVLYGNPVSDSVVPGGVYVNASQTPGEYHLVATSVAPAASFNGSGRIATLTFKVLNEGVTPLTLTSEIADHPEPGETTSELILHNDVGGSLSANVIPEFPESIVLVSLVMLVSAFLLFSKKILKKK